MESACKRLSLLKVENRLPGTLKNWIRNVPAMLVFAIASIASGPSRAESNIPEPFTATYAVTFRGISGGNLMMQWSHDPQSGHYIFETRANPSTLARLFVSSDAFERSTFESSADGIRPISWEANDGKSGPKGDGRLEFNWSARKITGTFEGKPVELPLEPGTLDRTSIQLGVMMALMQGKEPGTVAMLNGDDIRTYTYTRTKTESITTRLGTFDTVVYESTRQGSNRVSRVWHAPALGYVPVRAEQVRKGKVETIMELTALDRNNQAAH